MCIAFGTVLALKLRNTEQLRRRRLRQPNDSQFDKPFSTRPGNLNLPIKDKISLPLGVGDLDDIYDDKNPDVVPYNEGKDTFFSSLLRILPVCVYIWLNPYSTPLTLPTSIHSHSQLYSSNVGKYFSVYAQRHLLFLFFVRHLNKEYIT